MDAIKLLKQQHREVEELFAAIEEAEGSEKESIFDQIADALAVHATIEEKLFYPAAMSSATEDMLHEAVEEHLSVKRLIADLMKTDASDEDFDPKVTVLKEQIEHHVEEEEQELFPKVQKALGAEALEDLGSQMESMAAELMAAGEPRKAVPGETERAARID